MTNILKISRVRVHWSENSSFKEETDYSFKDFERRAYEVAMSNPPGTCYDKTKVTAYDNEGAAHGPFRLDLAENDIHGLAHYLRNFGIEAVEA